MVNTAHISAYLRLGCLLLLGSGSSFAAACTSKPAHSPLAGDDKVLAEVNGTPITKYDVHRSAIDAFGPETGTRVNAETETKLLQSLVQSRAISQVRERELSIIERAELEKRVAAYREQMLVKQYLSKHTRTSKVSDEAIRSYYESHKSSFGGRRVKSYELITSADELGGAQRGSAIAALSGADKQKDWDAWIASLVASGQPLALRRGEDDAAMLDPKLRQLIAPLAIGQTTQLTLIDGRPYVVRVTGQREVPARPLAEVRDQIRDTLSPVQLRDAVKQASASVLKASEVAYR